MPDNLKSEMIGHIVQNEKDPKAQQELLKELLKNPELIENEAERARVLKELVANVDVDSLLKQASASGEMSTDLLKELLKQGAGELSADARQKLVDALIKDAGSFGGNDAVGLLKDLDPQTAAQVIKGLIKNADNMDALGKQNMLESLLNNLNDLALSDEVKQAALEGLIKNLDGLSPHKKVYTS